MSDATSLETYLQIFARLRVNRSRVYSPDTHNRSPNKPLLLLAVLDLFSQGEVSAGRILVTPDLSELYMHYWRRVMPQSYRPNLALPFFHLSRDGGFWRLVSTPGNERRLEALQHRDQIRSLAQLREVVAFAQLDPRLVVHMSDPVDRELLRGVLIRTYFGADAGSKLLEEGDLNQETLRYSTQLLQSSVVQESRAPFLPQPSARDRGFRRAIVLAYDYRCCMCGIRVLTSDSRAAVEAAHIHTWSESHDDRPTNGLALCRLCHWSFDEGLLGADRRRNILVSPQLHGIGNVPGHLAQLADRPLIRPADPAFLPDVDALSWHRSHIYRSS